MGAQERKNRGSRHAPGCTSHGERVYSVIEWVYGLGGWVHMAKSKELKLRVDPAEYERWELHAGWAGTPVSAWIREACVMRMDGDEHKAAPAPAAARLMAPPGEIEKRVFHEHAMEAAFSPPPKRGCACDPYEKLKGHRQSCPEGKGCRK